MCTARPGWQSITLQQQHYKKRMYNIRIDLPDIIKIDEENKYVRVEPMVTIGKVLCKKKFQNWTENYTF